MNQVLATYWLTDYKLSLIRLLWHWLWFRSCFAKGGWPNHASETLPGHGWQPANPSSPVLHIETRAWPLEQCFVSCLLADHRIDKWQRSKTQVLSEINAICRRYLFNMDSQWLRRLVKFNWLDDLTWCEIWLRCMIYDYWFWFKFRLSSEFQIIIESLMLNGAGAVMLLNCLLLTNLFWSILYLQLPTA